MLGKNESFNNCITKFENFYSDSSSDNTISIELSESGSNNRTGEFIDIINTAIDSSRCVIINYTNRRLETSERVIEPLKIYFLEGFWYFAGFCRERKGYRQFKISRITNLSLGEAFIKGEVSTEDLDIIFSDSFKNKSIKVTLRFSNRIVNHLTEHFSEDKITINEDGTAYVTFNSPNEEGLKKYILSFGVDCEVLTPPLLRSELKDYIEKLLKLY